MKLLIKSALLLGLFAATPALSDGDIASGAEKASMCAACHGIDGNSAVSVWPKLAGQHEAYLARHLRLIKSNARPVAQMTGISAMLSEQDMDNLAAYYASQEAAPAVADPALVSLGEKIYRAGNAETGVPACMACHGPAGKGNPLSGYPVLAGQHADYTASMLTRYRAGENWGEEDALSKIMNGVAEEMTDEEIAAVSSYVQGLYSSGTE
ncbi:MAG: cytochrome c4 [Xanthomonadales bacterium]|nr:cytochrome c4 [Xanthomonadales bacterium]NNL95551.1 cytochrome c4 [Xanthomonadales bacterium]